MNLGTQIAKAIEGAGLTQAEVARSLGVTPQAVSGWIATGRISKANLVALGRLVKRDIEAMITGAGTLVSGAAQVEGKGGVEGSGVSGGVPVVGFVIASPHGDGYFTDGDYPVGHGESYVRWPTTDPNAYAVRVRGDSMQPRARPGEVIVVEPNRMPQAGEDVIVRCRDGRKMIKQLLWQRDGEVTLGSINSAHSNVTIQLTDIESIHFIAAIVQRPNVLER